MLTTNANFDTKHALAAKTPLYLVHFDIAQGALLTDDCSGTITDLWDISHYHGSQAAYVSGAMKFTVVGSSSATYGINAHTISNWTRSGRYEIAFDYKHGTWLNDDLVKTRQILKSCRPTPPTVL